MPLFFLQDTDPTGDQKDPQAVADKFRLKPASDQQSKTESQGRDA